MKDKTNKNAARYLAVIDHNLGNINGTMDYFRITECIIRLADYLAENETSEETWWLGEHGYLNGMDNIIVGAFWHYTEWHGGKWSQGYRALSALGRVFEPNMSLPEPDNDTYQLLNDLAEKRGI